MENMIEETQEDLLMDEDAIIEGMLAAADFKKDDVYQKKIEIVREVSETDPVTGETKLVKKKFFEFKVRPLDDGELTSCRKKATTQVPSQRNKNIMEDAEVDISLYRSLKIYEATVGEYGKKIWDNHKVKAKFGTKNALDVINEIMPGGEKDWVDDIIDTISGYGVNREEQLKK